MFDTILNIASANKLEQEDIVKQIFVFSDMQFDSARTFKDGWTTSYDRIKQKYKANGYGTPRLIF